MADGLNISWMCTSFALHGLDGSYCQARTLEWCFANETECWIEAVPDEKHFAQGELEWIGKYKYFKFVMQIGNNNAILCDGK